MDEDQTLYVDGFGAAFIGYVINCNGKVACYDYDKCIEILRQRDKMSLEEAIEYFEYNVLGAYFGEYTPCYLIKE